MQTKISFNDNKNKFYLGLSNVFINNPLFKAKIFEFFDYDIERVFNSNENDIKEFREIYDKVTIPRNFFSVINKLDLDKIYNEAVERNDKFVTFDNPLYPENLKNIEDFPLLLFYKGNFDNINFERTLGIVGSRKATEGAKQNVKRIVSGFVNTDVAIISGLASGIDATAHLSAIENNLKTIAVIGSGLDFKYPSVNSKLYNEIEQKYGIIFSEYPHSYEPLPVNFPQRNRIVTGLSKGVIIAEARMKSGAMLSARFALEQGRELMCIPGLITNPNCEGIYHLIKNGAGVITKTEDILNQLNWQIEVNKNEKINLRGLEKNIYDMICSETISIEGLKQKLDIDINELLAKLTEMELNGLIIQKNGLYYTTG